MSYFKNIVLGFFLVGAVLGVMVFGGIIKVGGGSTASTEIKGHVKLWGTFSTQSMTPFLTDYSQKVSQKVTIEYIEKDPTTFSRDLIEAIASGTPPDLVLMPDGLINHFKNKTTRISFTTLPADTYSSTFSSASDIFMANNGTIALPWAQDPLIMYYNRDMLQSVGIAKPPKNWQEFTDSVKLLTVKQSNLTLTQSAAAIGTYSNIAHAKDLLALFFLQTGSRFMDYDFATNRYTAYFGYGKTPNEADTASQIMGFYTAFADPVKPVYTWNAGQPLDRDMFTQSSLVYYFGSASELAGIRAKNPNLNFGIALPPQSTTSTTLTTGRIYGFAVPRSAPNQLLSYTAASLLTSAAAEQSLGGNSAVSLSLLPVRRDVLSNNKSSDEYLNFLYKTALVQKSWFDPAPVESDQILSNMMRNINSSLMDIRGALADAGSKLQAVSLTQ